MFYEKVKWFFDCIQPKHNFSLSRPFHLLQLGDPAIFPAVIVEHVPGADILNSYAGLACVEEPNDMITESSLDVAEEEIIDDDDDDITLTGVCAHRRPNAQGLGQGVLGAWPFPKDLKIWGHTDLQR